MRTSVMVEVEFPGEDLEGAREQALEALDASDEHAEMQYLNSVINVIDYHLDETFDETALY